MTSYEKRLGMEIGIMKPLFDRRVAKVEKIIAIFEALENTPTLFTNFAFRITTLRKFNEFASDPLCRDWIDELHYLLVKAVKHACVAFPECKRDVLEDMRYLGIDMTEYEVDYECLSSTCHKRSREEGEIEEDYAGEF